jgi:hypothetical protein
VSASQQKGSLKESIENLFNDIPSAKGKFNDAGRLKNLGENLVCKECLRPYSEYELKSIRSPSLRS